MITDANGNPIGENNQVPFGIFLEDVDNDKTPMQIYMEELMLSVRLHGVGITVMDNFAQDMQPSSIKEVVDNRIMPYIYQRSAADVIAWKTDDYGCLQSITFEEAPVVMVSSNGTEVVEKRYRIWTTEYSQLLKKNKENKFELVTPPVVHNLGRVPVILTYIQKPRYPSVILVDPPMYDIARINHVLYNKDSEIRDQERAQAFSNFYIQGDPNGNITLGPHNVIFIPMDATIPPGFASPDTAILTNLVLNAEKLRESLFLQAEQAGVVGVKPAESGIAAQWHFWAVESQLKKTSKLATNTEMDIAELFKEYTQTDFEYVVQYPDEFQPGDVGSLINTYKTIIDMGAPEVIKEKIFEKTARIIFSDEEAEEVDAIVEEIKNEYKKKQCGWYNKNMEGEPNVYPQ
jgi:hypothetical protein